MTQRGTPRLYVPALGEAGAELLLPQASARHARVLRLSVGSELRLFDGTAEAAARIVRSGADGIVCRLLGFSVTEFKAASVVLLQALPKASTLESIVRMAGELGATRLIPVQSERSVVRLRNERWQTRHARLCRIARDAARQSQRTAVLEIEQPRTLLEAGSAKPGTATGVCFAPGARQTLDQALAAVSGGAGGSAQPQVWLAVGPEGGLSPEELRQLEQLGFSAVGLGPGVLRVQTAATTGLALVLDRLGCFARD